MNPQFDSKSNILSGNDLRVLLNSEHISYGEVHNTLKEKGIFIGDPDKSATIPLLSSTLLTPDEFSRLIEASVNRESIPKNKSLTLELTNNSSDWISPLKDEFENDHIDFINGMDNIVFIDYPEVVVEDNKVKINYKVNRKDYSKDWLERELNFSGEITVEKNGNYLKLDFLSTHSSKETEIINKRITSKISKALYSLNIVTSDEPEVITFDSFNNEERVRFFKRLTAGKPKKLSIGTVDNIEISFDKNGPVIPNDPQISWMGQSVKRIKIDGERLNDIFLISDEKYYKHYHIQKMDIEFPFSFGQNSGICKVSFFFSSQNKRSDKNENSEFTFSCNKVTMKNIANSESKKDINKKIDISVKELIEIKYNEILAEREKP
ncbi:TPA: hypothetical protein PXN21_002772 [Yersinia enterocolitica]|nr:hypothetical protein [Yersinia enterocolitica]